MNEDYRSRLARLDLIDSPEVINNTTSEHAIAMIARMVGRARSSVLILTGSFNPDIYANEAVLTAFGTLLLGRSGILQILVHEDEDACPDDALLGEHGVLGMIADRFGDEALRNVELKRLTPDARKEVSFHFLVVDDKSFRFEQDFSKADAVGSFNQPSVSSKLSTIFKGMFLNCPSIKIRLHA